MQLDIGNKPQGPDIDRNPHAPPGTLIQVSWKHRRSQHPCITERHDRKLKDHGRLQLLVPKPSPLGRRHKRPVLALQSAILLPQPRVLLLNQNASHFLYNGTVIVRSDSTWSMGDTIYGRRTSTKCRGCRSDEIGSSKIDVEQMDLRQRRVVSGTGDRAQKGLEG